MSCYVFINIAELGTIRRIATEVARVLQPGGRYAVLDTNPDTTGMQFSTFRSGKPGVHYRTGHQREVRLHLPSDEDLVLHDYHWPTEVYERVLTEAGFRDIDVLRPLRSEALALGVSEANSDRLRAEAHSPPFQIVVARK